MNENDNFNKFTFVKIFRPTAVAVAHEVAAI